MAAPCRSPLLRRSVYRRRPGTHPDLRGHAPHPPHALTTGRRTTPHIGSDWELSDGAARPGGHRKHGARATGDRAAGAGLAARPGCASSPPDARSSQPPRHPPRRHPMPPHLSFSHRRRRCLLGRQPTFRSAVAQCFPAAGWWSPSPAVGDSPRSALFAPTKAAWSARSAGARSTTRVTAAGSPSPTGRSSRGRPNSHCTVAQSPSRTGDPAQRLTTLTTTTEPGQPVLRTVTLSELMLVT
jgi:hypothetical protein